MFVRESDFRRQPTRDDQPFAPHMESRTTTQQRSRVLVVEDNPDLAYGLRNSLEIAGYDVAVADDGVAGVNQAREVDPDLIVLDLMLPGMDGYRVLRTLRDEGRAVPVLILTARGEEADKVLGFRMGADDYVTKPFEPNEVLARVRAQLRRVREYSLVPGQDDKIVIGDLVIDLSSHEAFTAGRPANLTAKEFELMSVLARNRNKAMARDFLFEQVWGYDAELGVKALAVCMRRLRIKIEVDPDNPRYLLTVRGFGYKLVAPDG